MKRLRMKTVVPSRPTDSPQYYRPQETDEWHKQRLIARGVRGPTIPTSVTVAARAAKVRRQQEADEWIKKVRAR